MKIIFISGLYTSQLETVLFKISTSYLQNAPNVFQWAVVDGLDSNKVDFEVLSYPFLPCFPANKLIKIPEEEIIYNGKHIGKVVEYCTIPLIKQLMISSSIKNELIKILNRNQNEKIVVITYTPLSYFIKPIIDLKKKFKNLSLVSIITDLIDDLLYFEDNSSSLKRIQNKLEYEAVKKSYNGIDKFILLTGQMVEKISEANNKYIVVEGIASFDKMSSFHKEKKDEDVRSIFYAGTLQEFSGVRELLSAFSKITNKNYRLVICGEGVLTPEIKNAALLDDRIIYKGMQPREEVLRLQKESTLVINPRRPDKSITRFSFPSKTMEYLVSGTPMIGYKLEGIPEEYYDHFYTVDELDEGSLIGVIQKTLSLPQDILNEKAEKAYDFIMQKKTAKMQVKRIIDFISKDN
ncbi:MAG: glycosyltransferase [Alistipes sp.]|nr:glycosyltransferase [Alistipes sp.]